MRHNFWPASGAWRLLALFLAAPLLYVWPLTLQPLGAAYPPGSAHTDLLVSHLPNALYARHSLWHYGQFPLWNAQLFGGQPFAADPLSGLWYPPAWLLLVPGLPLTLGFNLLLALHLAWAGLGLFGLLRAEGLPGGPALFGGLAFAGAPKLVAHLGAGHVSLVFAVAWTPWLLWAVRVALARGGWRSGALAGACLASVFCADPRWAYYAGLLAAAYALFRRPWRAPSPAAAGAPPAGRAWQALAAFVVFAVLLSAAAALPFWEFVQQSNRATLTLDEAAVFSLPAVNLLGLLLRDVGGFHEYMTYAGTVTVLLALLGLGRRTAYWTVVLLAAAAFALGSHFVLFPLVYRLAPGLTLLRVPSRAWFAASLALCALAGYGAHNLTDLWWPRLRERYARVRLRLPSGRVALFWLALASLFDLARFNGALLDVRPLPAPVPAAAWLAEQPGDFRVYSPSYSLPPGDGLAHVDGVAPLQLAASVAFLEAATGVRARGYSVTIPAFDDGPPAIANRHAVPNAERLGLLVVRYVAAEYPLDSPGLTLVRRFGSTWVYENSAWRPRAWLAGGQGAASVVAWSPNRLEIAAEGPGRLVLGEVAYPGWKAAIDGAPVSIHVEHGLLRAVDLPSGDHRVTMSFRPASHLLGLLLTAVGLIGLVVLLWRSRRSPW